MAAERFICKGCGGRMEFDPKTKSLKCANCGTETKMADELSKGRHAIYDYERRLQDEGKDKEEKTTILECKSCGATIELDAQVTSSTCPYCASNIVLADKAVETLEPDGLKPFGIDRKEVGKIFNDWVKSKWFAPNELKNLYQSGKIMGVYLPYWSFDNQADCQYQAEGGKNRTVTYQENGETKSRIETDWYTVTGNIVNRFKNVIMRASKTLKDNLLKTLGGFNLENTVKFDSSYLSGYGSEVFKVPMREAYEEAKEVMRGDLIRMVEEKVRQRYDQVRNVHIDVQWTEEFYRLLLLPVYSMSYSFKGKTYQILINGENGSVEGEYPKSPIKIALVVLLVVVIIGLVVWFVNKK